MGGGTYTCKRCEHNKNTKRKNDQMSRPELNNQTSVDDFRDFYWLKEELVIFCRQYGLPTTGSKGEISARIEEFLTTGKIFKPKVQRKATADSMPSIFTRSTVLGSHWRCSQTLRAFFVKEIGSQFHFNRDSKSNSDPSLFSTLKMVTKPYQIDHLSQSNIMSTPR